MIGSLKINLRNQVLHKKNLYISTKRNVIAIDAAVDKAVYMLNGGNKLIILPVYCDIVTLITLNMLKLIEKGFDYDKDLVEVADHVNKNFSYIKEMTLLDDGGIEIKITSKDTLKIEKGETFSYNMLINIACVVLVKNSNVQLSKDEIIQFRKSLIRVVHCRSETEGEICMSME